MRQQDRSFPPVMSPVQEDGWLSPDGVYYPCGHFNHDEAALEIAGVYSHGLERRGWLHISDSRMWSVGELTQAQIDTLFNMQMVDPGSRLGVNIAALLK